mgnify:FL=1
MSFSRISNLGMFGITQFSAIINPPQCGILAVGNSNEVFNADMNVEKQMTMCLSYDRRALQEHEAAEFMDILKNVLETPKLLLKGNNESPSKIGL